MTARPWNIDNAAASAAAWLALANLTVSGPVLKDKLQEAFDDAQNYTGLNLGPPAAFSDTYDGEAPFALRLVKNRPIATLTSVIVCTTPIPQSTAWNVAGWFLDGCILRLRGYRFPREKGCVQVVGMSGYSDLPGDMWGALIEEAAIRCQQPKRLGKRSDGGGHGTSSYFESQISPGVKRVLDRYSEFY